MTSADLFLGDNLTERDEPVVLTVGSRRGGAAVMLGGLYTMGNAEFRGFYNTLGGKVHITSSGINSAAGLSELEGLEVDTKAIFNNNVSVLGNTLTLGSNTAILADTTEWHKFGKISVTTAHIEGTATLDVPGSTFMEHSYAKDRLNVNEVGPVEINNDVTKQYGKY